MSESQRRMLHGAQLLQVATCLESRTQQIQLRAEVIVPPHGLVLPLFNKCHKPHAPHKSNQNDEPCKPDNLHLTARYALGHFGVRNVGKLDAFCNMVRSCTPNYNRFSNRTEPVVATKVPGRLGWTQHRSQARRGGELVS